MVQVVDPTDAPEQGDFLFSFPVINLQDVSEDNLDDASFQVEYYDLVILSHSCDLVNKKLLSVIACPVWTLTKMGEKDPFFARNSLDDPDV